MRVDDPAVVDPRSRPVAVGALVVGSCLIGVTFGAPKGSVAFYVAGFALAATWLTAFALVPSRVRPHRRLAADLALGLGAGVTMFAVFVAAARVISRLPLLGKAIDDVFTTADTSTMLWVVALAGVNAVAEELFFRGTLVDAAPRRLAILAGVVPYALTTVPSGNVALAIAALVMGAVFTFLRIKTGALIASIATHLSWSALMITLFPR